MIMGNNGTSRARINALTVRNVKCVKEVQITPEGDIVEIRGDSGQGKTTVLESIEGAIRGLDTSMIRRGETSAEIVLETSAARINRIIHADGSRDYLTVTDPNTGKKIDKAAEFLKALFGPTAFNPLAWVQLGGGDGKGKTDRLRRQRDELLNAMPVTLEPASIAQAVRALGDDVAAELGECNLDEVDYGQHALVVCAALQRACYDYRKVLNSYVEKAQATLDNTPAPEIAAPTATLAQCQAHEDAMSQAYHKAMGQIEANKASFARLEGLRGWAAEAPMPRPLTEIEADATRLSQEREAVVGEIGRLRAQLQAMEAHRDKIADRVTALSRERNEAETYASRRKELEAMEESMGVTREIAIDRYREDLDRAKAMSQARRLQDLHDGAVQKASEAAAKSARFDALVELFRDALPKQIIASMTMPIAGLGVEGEAITLSGVPLHQLGTSQQIRVGVRIAAALNPRAGFILVDGAESLGREDRRALAEEAHELGVQLIMTYVDPDATAEGGAVVMRGGERVIA
jgi:energy-coupling factor transporter ATP-binding protein EcfA2